MKVVRGVFISILILILNLILGILYGGFQFLLFDIPIILPLIISGGITSLLFAYYLTVLVPKRFLLIFSLVLVFIVCIATAQTKYELFKSSHRSELSYLTKSEYNDAINNYLQFETGKSGLLGYILFEAYNSEMLFSFNGNVVPMNSLQSRSIFLRPELYNIIIIFAIPCFAALVLRRREVGSDITLKNAVEILLSFYMPHRF